MDKMSSEKADICRRQRGCTIMDQGDPRYRLRKVAYQLGRKEVKVIGCVSVSDEGIPEEVEWQSSPQIEIEFGVRQCPSFPLVT